MAVYNGLVDATLSQIRLIESHLNWLAPVVGLLFVVGVLSFVCGFGVLLSHGFSWVVGVSGLAVVVDLSLAWLGNRLGVRSQCRIDALKVQLLTLEKCRDSAANGVPFSLSVTRS